MSVIRPFRGSRRPPEWARRLVTGLAELPEDTGTLPPVAPPDPAAYDESEAALYVYRQGRRPHRGRVRGRRSRPFVDGQVRGHEAVQAQRVDSLVKHHATTDAPPALVALLHHAGPTYPGRWTSCTATPPLLDFAGPSGLEQTGVAGPPGSVRPRPSPRS